MRLNWTEEFDSRRSGELFLCKSSKGQRHTFGSRTRQGITGARSYGRGRRSFMIMADQLASDARTAILNSIRAHLAESALHDHAAEDRKHERAAIGPEDQSSSIAVASSGHNVAFSAVEMFREKLEMVGGHCVAEGRRFVRLRCRRDGRTGRDCRNRNFGIGVRKRAPSLGFAAAAGAYRNHQGRRYLSDIGRCAALCSTRWGIRHEPGDYFYYRALAHGRYRVNTDHRRARPEGVVCHCLHVIRGRFHTSVTQNSALWSSVRSLCLCGEVLLSNSTTETQRTTESAQRNAFFRQAHTHLPSLK